MTAAVVRFPRGHRRDVLLGLARDMLESAAILERNGDARLAHRLRREAASCRDDAAVLDPARTRGEGSGP